MDFLWFCVGLCGILAIVWLVVAVVKRKQAGMGFTDAVTDAIGDAVDALDDVEVEGADVEEVLEELVEAVEDPILEKQKIAGEGFTESISDEIGKAADDGGSSGGGDDGGGGGDE